MPEPIRVLCLRARRDPTIGEAEPADWVPGLARHATVTIHEGDADLAALCAAEKPDLIVLEGLSRARPWPPEIANGRACPAVPRLLTLGGDPWEPLRGLTLRLAATLGIGTVFVPGEAHRQHMPELAALACHLMAPSADTGPSSDRGDEKIIPVTVLDHTVEPGLHPWRAALAEAMHRAVPVLTHAAEPASAEPPAFPLPPAERARLVRQSWFCAVDTGLLDAVSPDHLAVPAAGAVLLAPPSPALAALGFADMVNCLLGVGPDLVRKVDDLSRLPDDLARIRAAGTALARRHLDGAGSHPMLDWLACHRRLKAGQVVQQVDRYGPFRGMTPTFASPSVLARPAPDSAMTQALRKARAAILKGDGLREALPALDAATGWSAAVAEPLFLFSIFALLNGNPVEAAMGIGARAERLGAIDDALAAFDPVEAAWLLLVARLVGHAPLEAAMREQAAAVQHLSLRRMLWLLDGAEGDRSIKASLLERQPDDLPSVHWLGDEDFTVFGDLVRRVLSANRASPGHLAVARRLLAA